MAERKTTPVAENWQDVDAGEWQDVDPAEATAAPVRTKRNEGKGNANTARMSLGIEPERDKSFGSRMAESATRKILTPGGPVKRAIEGVADTITRAATEHPMMPPQFAIPFTQLESLPQMFSAEGAGALIADAPYMMMGGRFMPERVAPAAATPRTMAAPAAAVDMARTAVENPIVRGLAGTMIPGSGKLLNIASAISKAVRKTPEPAPAVQPPPLPVDMPPSTLSPSAKVSTPLAATPVPEAGATMLGRSGTVPVPEAVPPIPMRMPSTLDPTAMRPATPVQGPLPSMESTMLGTSGTTMRPDVGSPARIREPQVSIPAQSAEAIVEGADVAKTYQPKQRHKSPATVEREMKKYDQPAGVSMTAVDRLKENPQAMKAAMKLRREMEGKGRRK